MHVPRSLAGLVGVGLGLFGLSALSGCGGYTSEYEPPADGRARPVWIDDKVVVQYGGGPPPPTCVDAIAGAKSFGVQGGTVHVSGGFWVPVYYGPRIAVLSVGVAPPLRPLVLLPLSLPTWTGSGRIGAAPLGPGGGAPARVGAMPKPGGSMGRAPSSSSPKGSSSGGGKAGGGDLGKAAVVLVVVALVAMPIIAIALATGRPENEDETAKVIDTVHAYNDLARSGDNPCTIPELVPELAAAGAP